jgi:hypothetical protein
VELLPVQRDAYRYVGALEERARDDAKIVDPVLVSALGVVRAARGDGQLPRGSRCKAVERQAFEHRALAQHDAQPDELLVTNLDGHPHVVTQRVPEGRGQEEVAATYL